MGGDEVDRDRHPVEAKPFAQLVLDPVGVVARHEPRVVDVDADARRPGRDLHAVEEVQPLAPPRGRLPSLPQLAERAVQLRRRDPGRVLRRRARRRGRAAGRAPRPVCAETAMTGGRWRSRAAAAAARPRASPRARPTWRGRRAWSTEAFRATSATARSWSTTPSLASIRTSATSARSAASSARSSE